MGYKSSRPRAIFVSRVPGPEANGPPGEIGRAARHGEAAAQQQVNLGINQRPPGSGVAWGAAGPTNRHRRPPRWLQARRFGTAAPPGTPGPGWGCCRGSLLRCCRLAGTAAGSLAQLLDRWCGCWLLQDGTATPPGPRWSALQARWGCCWIAGAHCTPPGMAAGSLERAAG